jgi:hypothetical protein
VFSIIVKKGNAQHNGRVDMLSVKYKPFMLRIIMLNVVMLSVRNTECRGALYGAQLRAKEKKN